MRAPDGHIAGLWAEALRAAAPAQAPGSPRRGGPDPLSRRERDGVEALRSRVEDDDSLATHGWLTDDDASGCGCSLFRFCGKNASSCLFEPAVTQRADDDDVGLAPRATGLLRV